MLVLESSVWSGLLPFWARPGPEPVPQNPKPSKNQTELMKTGLGWFFVVFFSPETGLNYNWFRLVLTYKFIILNQLHEFTT